MRLELELPPEGEETATEELMALGIPGWEVASERPLVLRLWLLPEDAAQVERAMKSLHPSVQTALFTEPDHGWAQDWAPERVGPFVIASLGAPPPSLNDGEHLIRLAPALAFGGGEHPTTRLCLRAIPDLVSPGARVLDLGSGSGVLSIAAACRGARTVEAIDVDPSARRATIRAAAASAVDVRVLPGGLAEAEGPYDVILANILAPTLVEIAGDIRARLHPSGRVLLSGIRMGREREVASAYLPLSVLGEMEEDGWMAVLLGRP